jgi:hypothetical protein
LNIGFQAAIVDVTFSYLPATLYDVVLSDGTDAVTIVSGTVIYVVGTNFVNAITMQCRCVVGAGRCRWSQVCLVFVFVVRYRSCDVRAAAVPLRFSGVIVPASHLNDTVVSCEAPILADALVDVFVTNDGVRYSNGFQFATLAYQPVVAGSALGSAGAGVVWSGPSQHAAVPFDFDGSVMPRSLTLAFVLTGSDLVGFDPMTELVIRAALAAVQASPLLLPFTELRYKFYSADAAFNAAVADKPRLLGDIVAQIHADLGDEFVGVVGPYESSLSIPLATISAASPQSVRQVRVRPDLFK